MCKYEYVGNRRLYISVSLYNRIGDIFMPPLTGNYTNATLDIRYNLYHDRNDIKIILVDRYDGYKRAILYDRTSTSYQSRKITDITINDGDWVSRT